VRDGQFDVKHSPGGMVDAEFAVQYLVLSSHPELVGNVGNIALLHVPRGGLVACRCGQRGATSRCCTARAEVTPPALQAEQHAVLDLWHAVFGENSAVSAKA
jgi:glutamate-ammonia-ligase adenylyltransferase